MSHQKFNIAVVGLGFGAEFIPLWQKHPHTQCYAICQRNPEKLKECGSAVQRAQDGRLRLAVEAPEINSLRNEIKRTNRRRDKVTIASVVLLGGIVWLALAREPAWAGWGMVGVGIAWLIGVLRG